MSKREIERSASERASVIITESIDEQALAAARAYPELRIICLRCGKSTFGAEYEAHVDSHRGDCDVPSHWEAL